MAVLHTPWGFTGTVDQVAEAKRFAVLAPRFRVASSLDWQPQVSGSVARTVTVAGGIGGACGVADGTGVQDALAFDPNVGGSDRMDAIVARFDWSTRTVAFTVIKGTTSPPVINLGTSVQLDQINRIPGTLYDGLIGVQKVRPGVGLFTSGDLADCRLWGSTSGGPAITGTARFLSLLDTWPGAEVLASDTNIIWQRWQNANWAFAKYVGTDKAGQPMISLRNSSFSCPYGTPSQVASWPSQVDHGGGLLTVVGAGIRCNNYGKVQVRGSAFSDRGSQAASLLEVLVPFGGGSYWTELSDERQRETGYGAAGILRQTLTAVLEVAPNDTFTEQLTQVNTDLAAQSYDAYLEVTYIS